MRDATAMQEFAQENRLGRHLLPILGKWLAKKHFGLIEEALLEDEEVSLSFLVRFETAQNLLDEEGKERTKKLTWRTSQGYYAFALTNLNRLLYAHWRPFKAVSESVMFDRLTDVKISTSFLMGYVRVGTLEDDFYLYHFSPSIKRIGKIMQTAAIEHKIMRLLTSSEEVEEER